MAYISQYKNGLCLIEDECWYIGNVSENVAKKILLTHAKTPGSFLVLDCNASDADYILLVNNGNLIFNHDVWVFPDNSCLVGNRSFENLSSAVYYYTKHKISGVFLYNPTMESESTQPNSEESDIGPPPRVILEDEEELAAQNAKEHIVSHTTESNLDTCNRTHSQKEKKLMAAQNAKEHIVSHTTESNLDTCNITFTHSQEEQNSTPKCSDVSPSGLDLGSLTCISDTKVSPGFSSFETFKPTAQNRKQRCDSPIHKPLENKTILNTQKPLPASRIPKPKIYTIKTTKIKPPLIRRSGQHNLSYLTSIKKDEVTKPKKVPPPVPPRRSSLSTVSKTSLEEYADKLGSTEPQVKTDPVKESIDRLNNPTETECSKGTNKIYISSKNENRNKSLLRRSHVVEKSTRPRMMNHLSLTKPANMNTQMTKHASYESTEKNGQIVMTSTNTELEKVYKKITKFNWNSTEFSSHVTTPKSLSSSSSSNLHGSNNADNVKTHNCNSPHSLVVSSSSTCSGDHETKQTHNNYMIPSASSPLT